MLVRARAHRNPFYCTRYDEVEPLLRRLDSVEPEAWAKAFSAIAEPYEEKAARAEAAGDTEAAKENYMLAYNYHHVGWYPAPGSPGKARAYQRSLENYLKAARYADPPLVVIWGGIDAYKEERQVDLYLAGGMATLAVDIPGTGEAPLAGSMDAERMWDEIFDWVAGRPDLDGQRMAVVGASTGGYWAAKVAHTHRDRIRAAVNHGGMAHYAFAADWIAKAQFGEYPFELAESLAMAFGLSTYEEWVEQSPKLSLLDQGILDEPCAPLLLVNGVKDSVFPITDMYLLLEHGSPKSARFFPVGHMGRTPETEPMIARWVQRELTGLRP
ncbi:MAG: alpha/beta hydrolase [Deltaproteobacteria bacterium]|nr:alpha/beta hydrolase [Deltaproteobacteria bacterium]